MTSAVYTRVGLVCGVTRSLPFVSKCLDDVTVCRESVDVCADICQTSRVGTGDNLRSASEARLAQCVRRPGGTSRHTAACQSEAERATARGED